MPRDGSITREKILDAAYALILQRGYAGTSIDHIIERVGVSRGTFFYHFSTKDELAQAMIRRHAADDKALTSAFLERAEKLATDPLQQVLVFFGLYIELLEEAGDAPPGCLFASFSYEAGLFEDETNDVIRDAVDDWQTRVGAKLDEAIRLHAPDSGLDGQQLADFAYTVFEGSMVMARVRGDRRLMADHVRQYRAYLQQLFGVVSPLTV